MYLPRPLRSRLDAHDARVRAEAYAAARADLAAEQALDRYRYVFVVTYGRSGSTVLQGVLNALPRTLVRGENNLYLLQLSRALDRLRIFRETHKNHGVFDDTSAFYGLNAVQPAYFVEAMNRVAVRSMIGRFKAEDFDVLGFKEVLWHRIKRDEIERFFDNLDEAFPGVGYVLNTRDVDRTVGSGFWLRRGETAARQQIGDVIKVQQFLRRTRPDRVLDVAYEDLTSSDEHVKDDLLRRLAEFATGHAATDEVLATMKATMQREHGPNAFDRAGTIAKIQAEQAHAAPPEPS